jgi:hypothetical protein
MQCLGHSGLFLFCLVVDSHISDNGNNELELYEPCIRSQNVARMFSFQNHDT